MFNCQESKTYPGASTDIDQGAPIISVIALRPGISRLRLRLLIGMSEYFERVGQFRECIKFWIFFTPFLSCHSFVVLNIILVCDLPLCDFPMLYLVIGMNLSLQKKLVHLQGSLQEVTGQWSRSGARPS